MQLRQGTVTSGAIYSECGVGKTAGNSSLHGYRTMRHCNICTRRQTRILCTKTRIHIACGLWVQLFQASCFSLLRQHLWEAWTCPPRPTCNLVNYVLTYIHKGWWLGMQHKERPVCGEIGIHSSHRLSTVHSTAPCAWHMQQQVTKQRRIAPCGVLDAVL